MGQYAHLGLKRLYFDRIFHRSYWTWRKHPTIIVPTMLSSALAVIAQSTVTLAIIIFLTDLAARGRLSTFLSELGGPGGIFRVFQDPAFSTGLAGVIVASIVGLIVVGIIGGGFVLSAEYGTYLDAWNRDSVSVGQMLENGARRWKGMAWTLFLTSLITTIPATIGYVLIQIARLNATTPSGVIQLIISSYVADLLIVTALVISIFTLYAYPAVAVDRVSGLKALRHSFGVASHHLGISITYGLVAGIFQFFFNLIILAAGIIGLPLSSLTTVLLGLFLTPILHTTKTMIYSYASPSEPEMPFQLANPIWNDIGTRLPRAAWRKIRTGLSEISHFLLSPRNLPFHIASTLAFFLGVFLGDYVSRNGLVGFLGIQPGRINPVFRQVLPPALGLDIFFHNWLVSIATALAGLGFGLPSFEAILFNGFILGVLIPAFSNLTLLLAGILPHGIIEIPSLILSGSVGLKLGYAALKARFQAGPENSAYLSAMLRQAIYVVVGLAPLFLIAGLIEGDITPIIMRMLGWTG